MVGSNVMGPTIRYSCLARPDLLHPEYRFHIHYMKKGLRKLRKNFDRDPMIGSKVMACSNRYSSLARPDLLSPSIDSTSTIWKRTSRNSSKILKKLWPVQTVTLAWRDHTSSSPSIDSTSTIWKRHPETPIKFRSRSNGRIKSYCLYELLL